MPNSIILARFLRARARWRLDSAGVDARQAARSAIALLDAASFLRDVPDDHPDIVALEAAGCFRDGGFEPGADGARLVRNWRLADETTGDPQELLSALAATAGIPVLPRFSREFRRGRAGVR
ncbi:MAG: hypothetical protein ACRDN0_09540 [Trebonia sp.]